MPSWLPLEISRTRISADTFQVVQGATHTGRRGFTVAAVLLLTSLVCFLALTSPSRAARSADAPPDSVSGAELASQFHCERHTSGGDLEDEAAFVGDTRTPLVFVTGTGASGDAGYAIGKPAFDREGRTVCWTNFPDGEPDSGPQTYNTTGDIQISVQYLVYAIRKTYELSGRKVAIFGISQGALLPRIALTYWKDLRSKVSDVIGAAGTHHGTNVITNACNESVPCPAAGWQQKKGSNLLDALNSQPDETPGANVAWTTIRSLSDQTVRPVTKSAKTSTSALKGATNILIQSVCKGRSVSHIGTALDSVTFAAIQDAVNHRGPAKISRLPKSRGFCAKRYAPPFDNATGDTLINLANGVTGGNQTSMPRVSSEPAVDAWFTKIHR